MTIPIILASASDIRSKLLNNADINHEVIPANIDEEMIKASLESEGITPRDMADVLAEQKAKKISLKYPDAFVIGSDQVLDFQGQYFSKPKSPECLVEFLVKVSGEDHRLYSSAVIYKGGRPVWRHVGKVTLAIRDLSKEYIRDYVISEWDNIRYCVGGYKIEDKGLRLFDKIEGDYFVILGLPLLELIRFLAVNGALKSDK